MLNLMLEIILLYTKGTYFLIMLCILANYRLIQKTHWSLIYFQLQVILFQVSAHFAKVICIYCQEVRLHPFFESRTLDGLYKA